MKMAKKILSVVLIVSLLCSVFALVSSALDVPTYAPTNTSGDCKIVATAKNASTSAAITTVAPGDVIALSMEIQSLNYTTNMYAFQFAVPYNNTQLTPCSSDGTITSPTNTQFRVWTGDCVNWAKETATVNFNYAFATQCASYLTSTEQTYYNKAALVMGTLAADMGLDTTARWDTTQGAFITMYFKVLDTAVVGEDIWVGIHEAAFLRQSAMFNYDNAGRIAAADYDFSKSMVKLTVASAATMEVNPIENALHGYGNIRFKTNATGTEVADTFDIRVMSSITNVAELYADENEFKNDIADIGFVFSASEMTAETAKTVAEGGTESGVTKKSLDDQYLQRVTAGSEYKFSCMITDINYSDVDSTLYAYAYVQTTTNGYFYYPAVVSVSYSTLYNTYVDAFKADQGIA